MCSAGTSLCVSESLIASEEALEMPLVFLYQLRNIILIFDLLSGLVQSELFKGLDLGITQGDTLGGQEFAQDVDANFA